MNQCRKTFLYHDVSEKIKEYILSENMQIGSFLPSERTLAVKFGIAFITLRKALNNLILEGILVKIPRKGSRLIMLPKIEKRRPVKKRIGLTIWLESGINHPGNLNALKIMGETFPVTDYEIVIIYITKDMIRNNQWDILLRNEGLDALFVSVQEIPDKVLAEIKESGVPSVFTDREDFCPGAWVNEYPGISNLLKYLKSLGHQKIAFITGQPELPVTKKQVEAFLAGANNIGISSPEKYIIAASYDEGEGYRKTLDALEMPMPPTAFLLGDDFMAMGALKALNEKKLNCPQDISVACFDSNQLLIHQNPGMTILKGTDSFSASAKILRNLLENENTSQNYSVIIERELVVRESTSIAKPL